MGRSTKPRKPMKQRPRVIPALFNVLTVRDELPEKAHEIYGAVYAFLDQPSVAASNNLCRVLCEIAAGLSMTYGGAALGKMRDEYSISVQSAVLALEAFTLRCNAQGDMTVRSTEAMTLKAAAGKLDEALGVIPWHIWPKACLHVKVNMNAAFAEHERNYQAQMREMAMAA